MKDLTKHLERQVTDLKRFFDTAALDIIKVEGLNHIEEAFDNEGFTNKGFEKWKARKTTDRKGRDLTRYRTNRRGKAGNLTRFGRQNEGRAILTGHGTGGNKLRSSYFANKLIGGVRFQTRKNYAQRHNEGLKGMPRRKHAGQSAQLDQRIKNKMDKNISKILK